MRNEIFISAKKEKIWFWLTNATSWPSWYPNSSNIKIINQPEVRLLKNTTFKWRTFNTNIRSQVKEFVPNEILAWEAIGIGLKAYHSWRIVSDSDGCHVITEETQNGWLPTLFSLFIKKGLLKQHQIWLEGLKKKSTEPIA